MLKCRKILRQKIKSKNFEDYYSYNVGKKYFYIARKYQLLALKCILYRFDKSFRVGEIAIEKD